MVAYTYCAVLPTLDRVAVTHTHTQSSPGSNISVSVTCFISGWLMMSHTHIYLNIYLYRFRPPAIQPDLKLRLKSGIDLTSKYLTLSDINSRVSPYSCATVHIPLESDYNLVSFSNCVVCISAAGIPAPIAYILEHIKSKLLLNMLIVTS